MSSFMQNKNGQKCFIQYDFSGIPGKQEFGDQESAVKVDLIDLNGTDLYCDPESEAVLQSLIRNEKEQGQLPPLRYFDSGNYHYMSKLLALCEEEPFTLIVFDHHTDMQPSGLLPILSCGSWVYDLLQSTSLIRRVISIGPVEASAEEARNLLKETEGAWDMQGEGAVSVLPQVTFITEETLLLAPDRAFFVREELRKMNITGPVYLSVDKDVLSKEVLDTTWDQGILSVKELQKMLLDLFRDYQIVCMDVCGEPRPDCTEEEIRKSEAVNQILYETVFESSCTIGEKRI